MFYRLAEHLLSGFTALHSEIKSISVLMNSVLYLASLSTKLKIVFILLDSLNGHFAVLISTQYVQST